MAVKNTGHPQVVIIALCAGILYAAGAWVAIHAKIDPPFLPPPPPEPVQVEIAQVAPDPEEAKKDQANPQESQASEEMQDQPMDYEQASYAWENVSDAFMAAFDAAEAAKQGQGQGQQQGQGGEKGNGKGNGNSNTAGKGQGKGGQGTPGSTINSSSFFANMSTWMNGGFPTALNDRNMQGLRGGGQTNFKNANPYAFAGGQVQGGTESSDTAGLTSIAVKIDPDGTIIDAYTLQSRLTGKNRHAFESLFIGKNISQYSVKPGISGWITITVKSGNNNE